MTDAESSAARLRADIPELPRPTVIPIDSDPPPAELVPEARSTPYLLVLGSLNPRKNIEGAIAGFRRFADRGPTTSELLIAGGGKRIFRRPTLPSAPGVSYLGHVDDARRWALLAGARLLLMPSFLEGFGLPVLEALKVGTPVVASDIPVFRELYESAVEFVDPFSSRDIARGIERVMTDATRRAELRRNGREIASRYSGDRTARAYLELFDRVAGR